MIPAVVNINAMNLGYTQKLVADISDAQMTAQPVAGQTMNHPAWVLGHLCMASNGAGVLLGLPPALAEAWKDLFEMKTTPLADASRYPSKAEMLASLEALHERASIRVLKTSPDELGQPSPERARARFPSIGDFVAFLMTSHETTHLGQLSAWRRAMGLPGVIG
ncbi:MAG: DinB family protein [Planctomycetota bacterium]|nr:DinB family protein [Planctomycetota bacterium]